MAIVPSIELDPGLNCQRWLTIAPTRNDARVLIDSTIVRMKPDVLGE
ncbi:hypothetical protein LJR230_004844 [Trinickia sp. LjRoot230]